MSLAHFTEGPVGKLACSGVPGNLGNTTEAAAPSVNSRTAVSQLSQLLQAAVGLLPVASPASPSSCPLPTGSLGLFGSPEVAVDADPVGGRVGCAVPPACPSSLPLAFVAAAAGEMCPVGPGLERPGALAGAALSQLNLPSQ